MTHLPHKRGLVKLTFADARPLSTPKLYGVIESRNRLDKDYETDPHTRPW